MLNLLAWAEIHRNKLVAGFLGFIALVAVVYVWRHFGAQREKAGNAALLVLRTRPGAPGSTEPASAPTAADYLKVAEQHASTTAAARARLLAAGAFFTEGRYSEALTEFETVLSRVRGGPLAAQAAFGVAASLDALDRSDQAMARYQQVIAEFPEESVAGQSRLAMARLHEARSQPEAALRLYDEILRDQREPGPHAQMAGQQREALLKKHPELAGTNAPAATAP